MVHGARRPGRRVRKVLVPLGFLGGAGNVALGGPSLFTIVLPALGVVALLVRGGQGGDGSVTDSAGDSWSWWGSGDSGDSGDGGSGGDGGGE